MRYFAWRDPRPHEQEHFEVLVGRRWIRVGIGGLIAVAIVIVFAPGRRLKIACAVGRAALFGGLAMLGSGLWNALFPALRRVDVPVPGLPRPLDGVTIAHVSDLHYGMPFTQSAARRGLRSVKAVAPDLIVFTGDFVSYRRHLRRLPLLLRPLHARYGMYACVGNHDHWAGLREVHQMLHACGIELLMNEHRAVAIRGATLVIVGVDDLWDGSPDLERALAGTPDGAPVLLLAHSPDYATTAACWPVVLQLAGHSHGGHIRLPILGPLLLPRHGIRHDRGFHRVGRMWLYVSHGLGGWPLRIGCRAETTILTLRCEAQMRPGHNF